VASIVVATGEVLGARMAGPAIRAFHIARALGAQHDVVVATTREGALPGDEVRSVAVDAAELSHLAQDAEVFVVQGDLLDTVDPGQTVVVVDLYDPFHLEALEQTVGLAPDLRHRAHWAARRAIETQVRRGDLFLCASRRQRDFWLGHLAAAGRVNERTYADSPDLERLITVVPFGVEDEPPWPGAPALRDVVPGIGGDDLVLLWGGGIYDWFDPVTLLHAVDAVRRQEPRVRLFFAGARHPNPDVGETAMAREARAVSDRLGLTGSYVFFHDWVEYDQRARYLMEADIGVSTHVEHVETAFSFRTRILDYLWASLPVVTTTGDDLSAAIDTRGAGIAVPAGDVEALEAALLDLLGSPGRRAACATGSGALAREYRWSSVLAPLVEFCHAPRRAPDLVDPILGPELASGTVEAPRGDPRAAAGRAWEHVKKGEVGELLDKARNRFRREGNV
jgi:glycosyltransferase involved in cell wall biosynthesis